MIISAEKANSRQGFCFDFHEAFASITRPRGTAPELPILYQHRENHDQGKMHKTGAGCDLFKLMGTPDKKMLRRQFSLLAKPTSRRNGSR